MKMLRLLIDIGNTITLAAAAIKGAAGFTKSSLYLAIFNLLAETASSLQVLDMPLVEIDDEDLRVLFNLATRCHISHLQVHVYLAIFNLLAETASSFQVLDMPLVEINDGDMRVLFNLATCCHTPHLRIHEYRPNLALSKGDCPSAGSGAASLSVPLSVPLFLYYM
jgi:hypothetical protein